MKIVQINATCGQGSTGKICISISHALSKNGIDNSILYSLGHSSYKESQSYCSPILQKLQALFEKVVGLYGFGAFISTRNLIRELKKLKPDIVHLHNIHSHDCELSMLFHYLKEKRIKVFWTFHDCWAFTGYCTYFDYVSCNKWKSICSGCPQYKKYSLVFDKSKKNFLLKRELLKGLDLQIITPSKWLSDLIKKSFLAGYPVHVINNGIDLNVFKPTDSDFRKNYYCENKFLLLGIANKWEKRKGIDVFIRLAKDLDNRFQIILVGIDEANKKSMPKNIILIHRTRNQKELAELYSTADLFVNPTLEDNFPTVNIESLACGTPVITYATGGAAEMLDDKSGIIVERNNYHLLLEKLNNYIDNQYIHVEDCIKKAADYDQHSAFGKYIELYLNAENHNVR